MRYGAKKQQWAKEARLDKRRRLILLLGGKCARCDSATDLHFDHKDPSTKCINISKILDRSWDNILREASKCQLLCKPCHEIKTREDLGLLGIPISVLITCNYCGQQKEKAYRNVKYAMKNGQKAFYCGRSCMGKAMWRDLPEKRKKPFSDVGCGSHTKYTNYGCRCPRCTEAHRLYQIEYLKKRKVSMSL